MAPTGAAVHGQPASSSRRERVVNDFSIQVATVNGSGSQTANLVLLRSLLLMGIPASGKNMFPSNIAGLPTWYTIRASRALTHLTVSARSGEYPTGLVYIEPDSEDFLDHQHVLDEPLASLPLERTRPGREVLEEIMESLR